MKFFVGTSGSMPRIINLGRALFQPSVRRRNQIDGLLNAGCELHPFLIARGDIFALTFEEGLHDLPPAVSRQY
jgi:hypothetical protein